MNRRIEYTFFHWGPFVCLYKLTPEEIKKFKSLESGKDYRNNLAGHIQDEKTLNKDKVFELIVPYLNSYVQGYFEFRGAPLTTGYELLTTWINRQKKHEFNPPHIHGGHLSFVIYTEIPDGLDKECKENIADSAGPGSITFDFNLLGSNMEKLFLQTHSHLPKVGDMFIFPAGLPHWVYPFNKTEGERVSISGNIKLKDME